MRVLVVGSGGREHALVWKIQQSRRAPQIFCAPGNPGIGELAELVELRVDDIDGLRHFAERERIDLTVVGPELPLSLGIVDDFEAAGLRIFGPNKLAAQLEVSKAFAKELMAAHGVPIPVFGVFSDGAAASAYVQEVGAPIVVKADGLAAGKGVFICTSTDAAQRAIHQILRDRMFGDAGARVVIEEFVEGEEVSFLAFTDGTTILPLASSQDHKPVLDGDRGPNTGGMGAYSPAPIITPDLADSIVERVFRPVLSGLRQRGVVYKGILYAGLMIEDALVKVLEFNVRFGDPECQPLMLRLQSDLIDVMEAVIDERLAGVNLAWDSRPAVCVVLAAGGYPGTYESGQPIVGLERLAGWREGVVFHAGTARAGARLVTGGGRVLGVTALGTDIAEALRAAYGSIEKISWPNMHYRRDIGRRAVQRLSGT